MELGAAAQSVVLAGGGADVQGGKLIFDYSGSDPVSTIAGDIKSGLIYSSGTTSTHVLGLYDNGSSQITVTLALSGDADLNGTVNGADLNTVLSNYNKTGEYWYQGDFDRNGTVNGADLNTVLSNYNQVFSSTAAVPEPSTLLLAFAGLVGLLAYAWRKR